MKLFLKTAKSSLGSIIVLYVFAVFFSFPITFLIRRYSLPVYQTKALIQIAKTDQIHENYIDGEVVVLTSKAFLRKALERSDFDVSYYAKGEILTSELYNRSPFEVEIGKVNDRYVDEELYFVPIEKQKLRIACRRPGIADSLVISSSDWTESPFGKMRIPMYQFAKARKYYDEYNCELFFTLNDRNRVLNEVASLLEVKIEDRKAATIRLILLEKNPVKAADLLNSILDEFIDKASADTSNYSKGKKRFVESHMILDRAFVPSRPHPQRVWLKSFTYCFAFSNLIALIVILVKRGRVARFQRSYEPYLK
ncbi:MAG: hypothetical protein H6603_03995 [Flavobacteriales bacterium]|nr:hypothetical protein [Flavobacteriales bacterium]